MAFGEKRKSGKTQFHNDSFDSGKRTRSEKGSKANTWPRSTRIQFPRPSFLPRLEKRADPSRVSWLRVRATLRPSNRVRTNVDSRGLFSLYSPVTQKAERERRLMNEFLPYFKTRELLSEEASFYVGHKSPCGLAIT